MTCRHKWGDPERQTLIDLISHPAGYGAQMAGYVEIRVLEDRDIAVCEWFEGKNYEEKNLRRCRRSS